MIGAKTLGTLLLFGLGLCVSAFTGALRLERLLAVGRDSAFVVGALGTLLGLLMYRFWRLSEPSVRYLRFSNDRTLWEDEAHLVGTERRHLVLGENQGDAFDLSPRAHLAVCLALGLMLSAGTIDSRAVSLLVEFPRAVTAAGSTWCPPTVTEIVAPSAQEDPGGPGCALLRRAYELGYAKSLGDCEKKRQAQQAIQVCHLRQLDEPYLHYAFRLLRGFGGDLQAKTEGGYLAALSREFTHRLDRLGTLYRSQSQVMSSAPHASHHLWTNLPKPPGAFDERTCVDKYRELPYRLPQGAQAASTVFEHVLGRLLFETRYEPAAGYCREYHVHWASPPDACERLAKNPESFLDETGALGKVRATLARHRLSLEEEAARIKRWGTSLNLQRGRRAQPPPQAVVSFQCYVEGQPAEKRASHRFSLDGLPFTADALAVPALEPRGLHTERYRWIASLLAPTFHYGALLSEAGLSSKDSSEGMVQAFRGKDFLLSRAHALASIDAFLEPEWLGAPAQEDLLEVYPYHLHLKNYVHLFRRQYLMGKGRL